MSPYLLGIDSGNTSTKAVVFGIAGAALDVHDDEPLGEGNPWLDLPNVTLTPHLAGSTTSTWENSVRMVAEAIKEYADTGHCENTVNAEELEKS